MFIIESKTYSTCLFIQGIKPNLIIQYMAKKEIKSGAGSDTLDQKM